MSEKAKPSIRTRIVVMMSAAFAAMFVVLLLLFYFSMQTMLTEREHDSMASQAKMSENVLVSSVSYLPSATRDWSSWDNTYDYVLGDYDEFLDDSLTEYPFQLYRINFMTILDAEGNVVYEQFYDFWDSEYMTNPPDLNSLYETIGPATMASFSEDEDLDLTDTTQIGKQGFVSDNGGIYYVSSYPVIHSDETGPAVGSFMFGRIIDQQEIDFITESSGASFDVLTLQAAVLPEDDQALLEEGGELVVTTGDTVTAYEPMADIWGEDSILVSTQSPRLLHAQGNSFIAIILVVIALSCVLMLMLTILLLNRIIIRPIGKLAGEVNEINMDTVNTALDVSHTNKELDTLTGSINGMLSRIATDRDLIRANTESLLYSANYDVLTGLRNRDNIARALESKVGETRDGKSTFTVFFLDLDRFKYINDTLGHSVGDSLITAIADRIRSELPDSHLRARMGGDEFLIVVDKLGSKAGRQHYVEKIFNLFRRPFSVRDRELKIAVSIGSSTFPHDGQSAETLTKNAEIAMYRAKELGDGLYVPYEREFHNALQRKIFIENQIRSSIEAGCADFQILLQPKVSVGPSTVTSCEALIRWDSPDGVISPGEFISQAEESGLIIPLSWWIIHECCRMGRQLEESGFGQTVSINIPAQALLHEHFISVVREAVQKADFSLNKLDIEITESTLLDDMEKVNYVLKELHDMGLEISVDDFGTGYSSLSYLNELAVDRIKVDRSFIQRIGTENEDVSIVNAIVAMGKNLHMTVTAEGVETQQQYDFLKQIECDEVQGYFFSRPVPLQEYIAFCRKWRIEHEGP